MWNGVCEEEFLLLWLVFNLFESVGLGGGCELVFVVGGVMFWGDEFGMCWWRFFWCDVDFILFVW